MAFLGDRGCTRSVATLLHGHNKLFVHNNEALALVLDRWQFGNSDAVLTEHEDLLMEASAVVGTQLDAVGLRRKLIDSGCKRLAREVSQSNVARRASAHPRTRLKQRVCDALLLQASSTPENCSKPLVVAPREELAAQFASAAAGELALNDPMEVDVLSGTSEPEAEGVDAPCGAAIGPRSQCEAAAADGGRLLYFYGDDVATAGAQTDAATSESTAVQTDASDFECKVLAAGHAAVESLHVQLYEKDGGEDSETAKSLNMKRRTSGGAEKSEEETDAAAHGVVHMPHDAVEEGQSNNCGRCGRALPDAAFTVSMLQRFRGKRKQTRWSGPIPPICRDCLKPPG